MNTQIKQQHALADHPVSVELKLASLWASFMFLYIYVDYFHLYMPKTLENIQSGKVFVFDITPGFLIAALVSVSIPMLMIPLSVILPAKFNRCANIIIAAVYIPYSIFNLVGEAWIHMIYGALLEVALLFFIIYYAYKWPRN